MSKRAAQTTQSGRQVWETNVKACGPERPEWETSVKACGPERPEWETSVGDKCKSMRPRARRVGDKCGRQAWETNVKACGPEHAEWETSVGDKWGTNVKACGPERPEWETSVGDKRGKSVRPKAPRGRQAWETNVKACGPQRPEWNASPETKAKSCGPRTQPFKRSKNPIQVNLFGEQRKNKEDHKNLQEFCSAQDGLCALPVVFQDALVAARPLVSFCFSRSVPRLRLPRFCFFFLGLCWVSGASTTSVLDAVKPSLSGSLGEPLPCHNESDSWAILVAGPFVDGLPRLRADVDHGVGVPPLDTNVM